ncbi:MAG: YARHG domain-containing protein [Eubacteriales bacterium]|nr:YARHG domain-containing protein [Eubacteriales bacterium]
MYCKNCGAQIPDGAEFCAACGTHIKTNSNALRPTSVSPPPAAPQHRRNNTIIIGAIAAVAVVLIAAIVCFTVLTHGKQQAQLAQIQAEEQQAEREAKEKKEAEEKAAEEAKQEEEEQKAKEEEEAKKAEEEAKAKEEAEEESKSEVTTVNNYYYYNTGNPSDDYYTSVTSSGYLWPTDTQYITSSDLSGLSRDTVAAIRNEIYARHGYAFQQTRWQNYFAAKSWYYRDESCTASTVSSRLSSVEQTNIDTIVNYEESMGWR